MGKVLAIAISQRITSMGHICVFNLWGQHG